jgi:predicted DNA-binding transcriptional regulator AlpA
MQSNPLTVKHLLSKRAVLEQVPFSSATLSRRVAAGAFPRPVRIGKRRVPWVQSGPRMSDSPTSTQFNGGGE